MQWLKQSTSVVISFGPVLDSVDGVSQETSAAIISALDNSSTGIMLKKNSGSFAVRNQPVTASTYDAHGCFNVTLDAADTATLGRLRVMHSDPTTYLPVWQDFMVVPANVWDSMFGTEMLEVDAIINTTSVAAIASAVWNSLTSVMTLAGTIGKRLADYFTSTAEVAPTINASATQVANNALMLLGNNLITSMSDNSKAAKLCSQFYQQTIDAVLRAYTWNAATTRSAQLAASSSTPSFGFAYAYPLPADCLRVLSMQDETYKFRVENGYLLTDESEAYVQYIKRIAAGSMDSLLVDAVSARLAATIAFPLTNSSGAAESMWKLYQVKLDEAQTVDAFEGTAPQMASDDWVNSRR